MDPQNPVPQDAQTSQSGRSIRRWIIIAVVAIVVIAVAVYIFTTIRSSTNISQADVYTVFSDNLTNIEEMEDLYDSLTSSSVNLAWAFSDENKTIVENGMASMYSISDATSGKGAALLPKDARDVYSTSKELIASRVSTYERVAALYNAIYQMAEQGEDTDFITIYNDSNYSDITSTLDKVYQIYSYQSGSDLRDEYMDINKEDVAKTFSWSLNGAFDGDSPYVYMHIRGTLSSLTGGSVYE